MLFCIVIRKVSLFYNKNRKRDTVKFEFLTGNIRELAS